MRDMAFCRLPAAKASLPATKILRMRVERQKCRAPLLDQMIGHDDHRLCRKAKAFHLHGGGGHHGCFARADAVREQRVVVLKHPPYRVFLVLVEVVAPKNRAVHARKGQMRAVIGAQADIVERVVIEPGQTLGALLVLPDPFAEPVLDLLLRLARGNGFLLVDDARVLVDLVVDGGRASVERVLDQVGSKRPRRAPGRGVADIAIFAVLSRVSAQVAIAPEWLTVMLRSGASSNSRRMSSRRSPESRRSRGGR